jgi:hypothetical protein
MSHGDANFIVTKKCLRKIGDEYCLFENIVGQECDKMKHCRRISDENNKR